MSPSYCAYDLTALTPYAVRLITRLLKLSPELSTTSAYYHTNQATQISKLPSSLLRQTGLLSSIKRRLHLSSREAVLCQIHHPLDPILIHSLFLQLKREANQHVQRFERPPSPTIHLTQDVKHFLQHMRAINGLWTDSEAFSLRHGETWKYPLVASGCEACMISIVGGDVHMLTDLRASMLGRRNKDGETPRLTRFVDAWVDDLSREQARIVKDESEVLGGELRDLRKGMYHARAERRRVRRARKRREKESIGRKESVEPEILVPRTTSAVPVEEPSTGEGITTTSHPSSPPPENLPPRQSNLPNPAPESEQNAPSERTQDGPSEPREIAPRPQTTWGIFCSSSQRRRRSSSTARDLPVRDTVGGNTIYSASAYSQSDEAPFRWAWVEDRESGGRWEYRCTPPGGRIETGSLTTASGARFVEV